ncbi:MAG TPA: hypothetical protein VNO55_19080 [Polyangia bacterium]|nr:hypothetical protein [Polyangia bacterium]
MHRLPRLSLVAGCHLLLAACGPAPTTEERSFEVTAILTVSGPVTPSTPLTFIQQRFTLVLDPVALTMMLGNESGISQVPVTTDDHVTFRAVGDVTAYSTVQTSSGAPVTYDRFQVRIDGDRLDGQGAGVVVAPAKCQGSTQSPVTGEIVGTADRSGPSLQRPYMGGANPLAITNVIASEPLPATTRATLTAPGDTVDLLPVVGSTSDALAGFQTPPGRALLFGQMYQVVIDPWADFAGNPGLPTPSFMTIAMPPLDAQDGFEGTGPIASGPAPPPNPSSNLFPPISGSRSALIGGSFGQLNPTTPGDDSLWRRLTVPAGAQKVHFALRPIGKSQATLPTTGTTVYVGVPGAGVNTGQFPATVDLTTPVTVSSWPQPFFLGDIQTIEIPLPDGAKDEVVFSLHNRYNPGGCLGTETVMAYLIDDLVVE